MSQKGGSTGVLCTFVSFKRVLSPNVIATNNLLQALSRSLQWVMVIFLPKLLLGVLYLSSGPYWVLVVSVCSLVYVSAFPIFQHVLDS